MDDCEVHECHLFEHELFTVNALALDERQGVLAVSRRADVDDKLCDAIIEFWNVIGTSMFLIKTVPVKNCAQSLLWIGDSLLSACLDGTISIMDLHSSITYSSKLASCSIWCLDQVCGKDFCAGTDSGAVLLLSLQEHKIVLLKTISTGSGVHVLSLASTDNIIAAGSIDYIFLINPKTARIQYTLKLSRAARQKPTIVWSLCFINTLLASGDSAGFITFWDPSNGAFIQTLQTHQADILSLAYSGHFLYAAGVDPTIARLTCDQKQTMFRAKHRRTIHNNDVNCLVASKHRSIVYSGGAEHYLCASSSAKQADALKNINCSISRKNDMFCYQYSNHMVIWKAAISRGEARNGIYSMNRKPVKLAQIRSESGEHILASALSHSGDMLAVSTIKSVSLYALEGFGEHKITKITVIKRLKKPASALLFTEDRLMLAYDNFTLSSLPVASFKTEGLKENIIANRDDGGIVTQLHSNNMETLIVILTTRNEVFIVNIAKKSLQKLELSGSDVVIDAQFVSKYTLYILCADRKRTLLEYDAENNQFNSTSISSDVDLMFGEEPVLQMDCSNDGILLTGANSNFRIITFINRKRVVLGGQEAQAVGPGRKEIGDEAAQMHRDRCPSVRWICSKKLLLSVPKAPIQPTQTPFRLKRFGQN